MMSVDEKRRQLYSDKRKDEFGRIKTVLTKSSVLQKGEYNFTPQILKDDIWDTCHSRDFVGTVLNPKSQQEQKSQLGHHFQLGNASGVRVPLHVYRQSTTMADYPGKIAEKVESSTRDRTINWPDMAPRYMTGKKAWQSEYQHTFAPQSMSKPRPLYPRVDTSKLKLPLDAEKFWHQRGTNMQLGTDKESAISEHKRAYAGSALAGTRIGVESWEAGVSRDLKEQSKVSHVFRSGDYDNIAGAFKTICNEDYGPRVMARSEQLVAETQPKTDVKNGRDIQEDDNALTSYARKFIVPGIMQGARDGLKYQTSTHLKLGTDTGKVSSIYSKDFQISPLTNTSPPERYHAQPVAQVLQNDPNLANIGPSCTRSEFTKKTELSKLDPSGQMIEKILKRGHTDSVVFSDDVTRHVVDRQQSLCHSDYDSPPATKTVQQVKRHAVDFDYLKSNDALPYPVLDSKQSEAMNNYIDTFMTTSHSLDRRRFQQEQCRERTMDGKSAHFTPGYSPLNYGTEMRASYTGRPEHDESTPSAGIVTAPNTKFPHLYISENTQDMKAADPYSVSTHESLMARESHVKNEDRSAFTNSVTSSEFKPPKRQEFTRADIRMFESVRRRANKPIASSHFFHTDNSGRNNYLTTSMTDYSMPETVTGQKLLSAL